MRLYRLLRIVGVSFALPLCSALACSSSSSTSSEAGSAAGRAASSVAGSAGAPSAGASDVNVGGSNLGGANAGGAGRANAGGSSAEAGGSAGAPCEDSDISQSSECAAFCDKIATCSVCSPAFDCAVPSGSCAAAERAYLACQAENGSFVCGADGYAVVSNCERDTSVCPSPPLPACAVGGAAGASDGGGASAGGNTGAGCSSGFEQMIATSGGNLCVAKQAQVPVANTGNTYGIDVTEVTRGQYGAWQSTKPALPPSTDVSCGWKARGGTYTPDSSCLQGACQGAACDHHPQVCIDPCDAKAYCAAVGKRLCGKIGGGANAYTDYADATLSQWYNACSSGGLNEFPFGNQFSIAACNAAGHASSTLPVGSLAACESSVPGFGGVYDLVGNVAEWEDSCDGTTEFADCRTRGGSFYNDTSLTNCNMPNQDDVEKDSFYFGALIGFRCCSD